MNSLPISTLALVGAAALLLLNGALSIALRLELERKLLISALRAVVQLTILGALLVPVFRAAHPLAIFGISALMILIAAREAAGRAKRGYRGVYLNTLVALLLSGLLIAALGTGVLIGVEPFWAPRYFIPFLGMILGNSLNGVSLGLDRALALLDEGRDAVELRLALGATRWEAARPVAVEAIRVGMIPIINTMSVVGLVSIPGMMTGQILGGTPPEEAARYQILILFLITASVAIG
ncbi:ABC transporter permease, partial [Myxococcota bacterium]|nr:ABC transporter permease [Myxococcota bacterium]